MVGGDVTDLPGFAEGEWWVQDAAAALPAMLLGDVRGKRVADLCAAPGGKTAALANAGARVTAVDISAERLKRLAANLQPPSPHRRNRDRGRTRMEARRSLRRDPP